MADIKTHLRELSVATILGLLKNNLRFQLKDLYNSDMFWQLASQVIDSDISNANNICDVQNYTGELRQIIDNGYQLATYIYNNPHFVITPKDPIYWLGNDTQKEDPADIAVGRYGFSLKEESFILENMGLYKLLNCYTGSQYTRRHIFKDYAPYEYAEWFSITWNEMLKIVNSVGGRWQYSNTRKPKGALITLSGNSVVLDYLEHGRSTAKSILPLNCSLVEYENNTTAKTREEVFAKFINQCLDSNYEYTLSKKECAIAASEALADELNSNLNYRAGLPRFLRIHNFEYYYAKTTPYGVDVLKVPSIKDFGDSIRIESIEASVPNTQANILTTIVNIHTGRRLILRNECRFSHGQFNGTPEAKMYYEHGGSLLTIYDPI